MSLIYKCLINFSQTKKYFFFSNNLCIKCILMKTKQKKNPSQNRKEILLCLYIFKSKKIQIICHLDKKYFENIFSKTTFLSVKYEND